MLVGHPAMFCFVDGHIGVAVTLHLFIYLFISLPFADRLIHVGNILSFFRQHKTQMYVHMYVVLRWLYFDLHVPIFSFVFMW